MAKSNTEDFIRKAKVVHGEKYGYGKVVYKIAHTKVIISCSHHGDFLQTPANHLSGAGCPICSGKAKSNTEDFIRKAKVVHGEKYGYENALYKNAYTKVIISCKRHGDFLQSPNRHLSGDGCPICAVVQSQSNTEEFVQKAEKVHGDKYTYGKVVYKTNKIKVIISCSHHGDFLQTPANHLSGAGCPICSGKAKSNTEDFIRKAKVVHGEKYGYGKVVYKIAHTKVIISCPHHGDFLQVPNDHLSGSGCPICGGIQSTYNYYREPTLLYYIYFPTLNIYKIGITVERIGVARRFSRDKIQFIVVSTRRFADGIEAYEIEQLLHRKYKKFKYTETEPLIGGNSELFAIPYEELQDVYETFNVLTGHKKELNNED